MRCTHKCWLVSALLVLAGCAGPGGVATFRPTANVALGPTADHTWLATRIAPRSDWPTVSTGYRLGEVTYYSRIRYDEQSYYNRFGSLYDSTQSVATGVWLR